jgi:drug/metabolite transporter (DMT)-like permease
VVVSGETDGVLLQSAMQSRAHPPLWKILLAFALIYSLWGSSFLAIRLGVREIPPFLLASMRGLIGGSVICGWMFSRGEPSPTAREWASASLLGILIFVFDYGLLFWAEQRVASGVAALMMSMNAVFMALFEILILRTQRLTARLAFALSLGLAGVLVLVSHALRLGGAPIDGRGAAALLVASISWSLASVLTRKLPLPHSKVMTSGMQMLAGGTFLTIIAAALGEFHGFHPSAVSHVAWLALAYLTVAASIVSFTAYVWLIHHESPTKVGTFAYVNPLVAVALGYFFAGEPLGLRTVVGALFILVSVVAITTTRAPRPLPTLAVEDPA